eukprot:14290411-Ditylum_brightwellii.AAC.1
MMGENIKKSEAENKSISRPDVTHVKYKKEPRYKPVINISSPPFPPCDTEFHIIKRKDCTGRKETLEPTPEVLLDHWFPLWLVRSFLKRSNNYRSERKEKFPNHYCWTRERGSAEFSLSNIFHVLAMLYYMGVV